MGMGAVVELTVFGIFEYLWKEMIDLVLFDLYQSEAPDAGSVDDISAEGQREHLAVGGGMPACFVAFGNGPGL